MLDLSGREVAATRFEGALAMDVSKLPAGVYTARLIEDGHSVGVQRILLGR